MVIVYPLIITLLHLLNPIAHVRMFVPVSLGLVLGAGYTVTALRDLRVKVALLVAFASLGTGSAINEHFHHAKQEDYKAAFAYADANGFEDAPVITCYDYSAAAAWEARPDATIYGVFTDATIRYPGPLFWRTVEMSMAEYRKASTQEKDAFLGGGLIVEGGIEAALSDADRVALFYTGCPENLVDSIGERLASMGFVATDKTLIRGKAASYTMIEPTLLNATLFDRSNSAISPDQ
ncbi:alpha/beta hydrolase [Hyphomonas sp.]|uniref:alpha/beta hydrolase n=1 Tax=Hyphomonas sp. TaxID=87 RepID=UPI003529280E